MILGVVGANALLDHERDAAFRLMFERSADAILLIDPVSNQFVEYNQATLDMLRCSRVELSALHPSELSPATQPDGRDSFAKANEMIAIALREGSHRFEWVHMSPHRVEFPVEVLLTPLPYGGRELIVTVWRDITERKRSERALLESQKMESVALLAGGIAHDFNNLLSAALAHLHSAGNDVPPAAASHIAFAEQALARAADLTRQLLAYSGRGRCVVESIDLGALACDMVHLLRGSVSPIIDLDCATESPCPIVADRAQVQQVVLNLVTNAVESIDGAGRVSVRVSRVRLDDEEVQRDFAEQGLHAGDAVRLVVTDTGRGMSPETVARMFEPYFTTKRAGRGLGLAALRGILRANAAGITVRSEVDVGTTITLVWPANAATVSAATPPRPVARTPRGAGKVLVVDDDERVRRATRMMLESMDFAVIEAADGDDAVARFRADRHQLGWVLMDLTMPHKDGYQTFLELREIDPEVVVVLCSGWSETELAERFCARAPSAFLPKPYTAAQLGELLSRLGLKE